ncbi:hypothetical protein GCM10022224_027130 [Nonomuraea antimicrobica]|uniref:Uncharacterized protein n=1 Tax=Nonomuraea antimicrobica TaxID=561173 RepID=A0ABP7BIV5_9ACTN
MKVKGTVVCGPVGRAQWSVEGRAVAYVLNGVPKNERLLRGRGSVARTRGVCEGPSACGGRIARAGQKGRKRGDPRRGGERGSPDRSGSGGVEPVPFQKKAFITRPEPGKGLAKLPVQGRSSFGRYLRMLPDQLEFRRGAISHFRQVFSPPHNDHIKTVTQSKHHGLASGSLQRLALARRRSTTTAG